MRERRVCVCVCVRRGREVQTWWIFRGLTQTANYTPTYFNLVPAFIRLFDKWANYNKEITLRPLSLQCAEHSCDWAAHLMSHHLSLCLCLRECHVRLRLAHLNNAPAHFKALCVSFCMDAPLSHHRLGLLPMPASYPCMGSIKTLFLAFQFWLWCCFCMWGAR